MLSERRNHLLPTFHYSLPREKEKYALSNTSEIIKQTNQNKEKKEKRRKEENYTIFAEEKSTINSVLTSKIQNSVMKSKFGYK